jgi:hypothetical protein
VVTKKEQSKERKKATSRWKERKKRTKQTKKMLCGGCSSDVEESFPFIESNHDHVLWFVNRKSGGRKGFELIEKLASLPTTNYTVVDLMDFVEDEQRALSKLQQKVNDIRVNLRAMSAGGDGSIAWTLSILEKVNMGETALGIVPLGVGNELGRCLGWPSDFNPNQLRFYFR